MIYQPNWDLHRWLRSPFISFHLRLCHDGFSEWFTGVLFLQVWKQYRNTHIAGELQDGKGQMSVLVSLPQERPQGHNLAMFSECKASIPPSGMLSLWWCGLQSSTLASKHRRVFKIAAEQKTSIPKAALNLGNRKLG